MANLRFTVPRRRYSPSNFKVMPNGHIIASNSDAVNADATHPSEIVEYTQTGQFVGQYDVNEAQGAAFGVAVGPSNTPGTFKFVAVNDVSNDMSVYTLTQPQH